MRLFRIALLLLAAAAGSAAAADAPYHVGREYALVFKPQPQRDAQRITVEEFFAYSCPHCFAYQPALMRWLEHKPRDVDFIPVPTFLGRPQDRVQSEAFFIAVTLGIADKTHEAMFEAIHLRHQPMNTPREIGALYASVSGIRPEQFNALGNSFLISSAVQQAESLSRDYGVLDTPAFIVGGAYRVYAQTDPAETLKVIDYLIGQLRHQRQG
jgi:thiol:disulfide interchange protein DsbA